MKLQSRPNERERHVGCTGTGAKTSIPRRKWGERGALQPPPDSPYVHITTAGLLLVALSQCPKKTGLCLSHVRYSNMLSLACTWRRQYDRPRPRTGRHVLVVSLPLLAVLPRHDRFLDRADNLSRDHDPAAPQRLFASTTLLRLLYPCTPAPTMLCRRSRRRRRLPRRKGLDRGLRPQRPPAPRHHVRAVGVEELEPRDPLLERVQHPGRRRVSGPAALLGPSGPSEVVRQVGRPSWGPQRRRRRLGGYGGGFRRVQDLPGRQAAREEEHDADVDLGPDVGHRVVVCLDVSGVFPSDRQKNRWRGQPSPSPFPPSELSTYRLCPSRS